MTGVETVRVRVVGGSAGWSTCRPGPAVTPDPVPVHHTAHRGDVVTMPAADADRLVNAGAVVVVGEPDGAQGKKMKVVRVVAAAAGWSEWVTPPAPEPEPVWDHHTAYRGEVVDVPAADAERLIAAGAVEPVEAAARDDAVPPIDGVSDPDAVVAMSRTARRAVALQQQRAAAAEAAAVERQGDADTTAAEKPKTTRGRGRSRARTRKE